MTLQEYNRLKHTHRYKDPAYREATRAKVLEYKRLNPDKVRETQREYRKRHAAEIRAKRQARWQALDPEVRKLITKEHHLWKRYRLRLEDIQRMYVAQKGACPICCRPLSLGIGVRGTHVDHDHESGKIRDLLCFDCNRSLGIVERADWVRAAFDYLQRHGKSVL